MSNYWDKLMATDEGAATYMDSYGEGPGCETRRIIGSFINDGEKVLDVGCGPGWNLDHFQKHGPSIERYKGVDYSRRFIRIANERHFATLPYEQQDCRELKEPNESWDVVILQDVLEHTNGYKIPVQEALRVAKRRVIITFWRTFSQPGEGDQINDDGNDGYGATYEQEPFEQFLDDTGYAWETVETSPNANRWHKYYVIYKETA